MGFLVTVSGWCSCHFYVNANPYFRYDSLWIFLPTQFWCQSYSLKASMLHSLIIWLTPFFLLTKHATFPFFLCAVHLGPLILGLVACYWLAIVKDLFSHWISISLSHIFYISIQIFYSCLIICSSYELAFKSFFFFLSIHARLLWGKYGTSCMELSCFSSRGQASGAFEELLCWTALYRTSLDWYHDIIIRSRGQKTVPSFSLGYLRSFGENQAAHNQNIASLIATTFSWLRITWLWACSLTNKIIY